jgi:hypothetical protein
MTFRVAGRRTLLLQLLEISNIITRLGLPKIEHTLMRLFKSKSFSKFAQKERLSDSVLCAVIKGIEAVNIDADYGGGVIHSHSTLERYMPANCP